MSLHSFTQSFKGIHVLMALIPFLIGCNETKPKSAIQQSSISSSNHPNGTDQAKPELKHSMVDYSMQHTAYYSGSCDGSGGVALDQNHFAVVNDETSYVLIYKRHEPGAPIQTINIRKALELKKKEEGDLEGLALMGDYLFVLGSHSRDRDGNKQKERRKLLAIRLSHEEGAFDLKPVGDVYEDLMDDLEGHDAFKNLELKQSAKESGDDPDGFNIEGICSGSDGVLWLCFRGPSIGMKALLIPITNPTDVIAGARAHFGTHRLLDLQGRTIRGADDFEGHIVFVSDSAKGGLGPAIYLWDEQGNEVTELRTPALSSVDPESVILFPDTGLQELLILSDDGGRRLRGKDCKDWNDESDKRFRSVTYRWSNP